METSRLGLCAVTLTAMLVLTACGGSGSSPGLALAPGDDSARRAFQDCMTRHGAPPTDRDGGPTPSMDDRERRAFRECASLRPSADGRDEGPGLRFISPLQHCMAKNGVQIPENVRPADLENSDDPKIIRALRKCRDLLPRDTVEPTAHPS